MADKPCKDKGVGKCSAKSVDFSSDDALSIKKSKSSIANRLDRLETEINLLIMLSTSEDRKFDKPERPQTPTYEKEKRRSSLAEKKRVIKKGPPLADASGRMYSDEVIPVKEKHTKEPAESTANQTQSCDCRTSTYTAKSSAVKSEDVEEAHKKRRKEKREHDEKNSKRIRKKKSVCRCNKKAEKSTAPAVPAAPVRKLRRRSMSAGAHFNRDSSVTAATESLTRKSSDSQLELRQAACKSCPGSIRNIQDLCSLVVDLSKHQDFAKAICDEWKSNCASLQQRSESAALDAIQERQALQQRFMDICFQTEMEHRRLLESVMSQPRESWVRREELSEVRASLEQQRARNDELLCVCDELRSELQQKGERMRSSAAAAAGGGRVQLVCTPTGKANCSTLEAATHACVCVGTSDGADGETINECKKQIQEHLSEIEELRLTCAKNAEWACEESSQKSKLMKENRYLQSKVTTSYEREQKQLDHINIMRRALKKVGKDNPKVKKLLEQLQKYDLEKSSCPTSCCSICLEPSDKPSSSTLEAEQLIADLNTVIKIQSCRIKDLVELTSALSAGEPEPPTCSCVSEEQAAQELAEARSMAEDMKSRYAQLADSVRGMREIIQQGKAQLREECEGRACLQKQLSTLTNMLEESKCNLTNRDKTIDELNNCLSMKDCQLKCAQLEVAELKESKNALNEEIKELYKERDSLKSINECLTADTRRQECIISNLEKKVELQRHEHFLQQMALDKEKAEALRAAQFTADKLLQAMDDHQRDCQCFTTVRNELTQLLQEKDEQLRNTIETVSAMACAPEKINDTLKALRCSRSRCRRCHPPSPASSDPYEPLSQSDNDAATPNPAADAHFTAETVDVGIECACDDDDDLPLRVMQFLRNKEDQLYDNDNDADDDDDGDDDDDNDNNRVVGYGRYDNHAQIWCCQAVMNGQFEDIEEMSSEYTTPPLFNQLHQIQEEDEEALEADANMK